LDGVVTWPSADPPSPLTSERDEDDDEDTVSQHTDNGGGGGSGSGTGSGASGASGAGDKVSDSGSNGRRASAASSGGSDDEEDALPKVDPNHPMGAAAKAKRRKSGEAQLAEDWNRMLFEDVISTCYAELLVEFTQRMAPSVSLTTGFASLLPRISGTMQAVQRDGMIGQGQNAPWQLCVTACWRRLFNLPVVVAFSAAPPWYGAQFLDRKIGTFPAQLLGLKPPYRCRFAYQCYHEQLSVVPSLTSATKNYTAITVACHFAYQCYHELYGNNCRMSLRLPVLP
jgi:hypothetical protein